jgi:hypothetical protein
VSDELPEDPWPEVKPHTIGSVVIDLTDGIRVTVACLDCGGEIVGEACCPAHGAEVLAEHAIAMGTT